MNNFFGENGLLAELENKAQEMQELKMEIQDTHMGAYWDQFIEKLLDGKYMTAENVPVRRMPSDNEIFYSPNELS